MQVEDYEQDNFVTAQNTRKNTKAELIMETMTKFTNEEVSGLDKNENKIIHVSEIFIEIEEEISQNNSVKTMDTTEQENIFFEKKNLENTVKVIEKDEIAIKKQKSADKQQQNNQEFENGERLTPILPSIREEVPETEMNILKKSLEDGNSEEIILPPLNHYVEKLAENEDSILLPTQNENDVIYVTPAEINKDIRTHAETDENVTTPAKKKDSELPAGRGDDVTSAEQVDGETVAEKEATKTLAERDDMKSAEQDKDKTSAKKRKKRRDTELKKSYVDFMSEEEDFIWDSTSWKETGDESTSSELDNQKNKRKKLKKRLTEESVGDDGLRKKRINKKRSRKEAKQSGKEYRKKDGSMIREKQLQENPCMRKKCGHDCGNISEEKRRQVFDHYWSLAAERKKDWLVSMTSKKEVKRKRSKDSTYRANTFEYFINEGEGRRQVCLQFMMKTLDVTQRYIYYTVSNATMGSAKSDLRGKTIPTNKTSETVRMSAINFIKKLPALPSHYCRKDSTRLYLPVEFRNIKNLYKIYKEEQVSKGVDAVSDRIFREIFTKDFNIGFHVPKKDKCLKCLRFEGKDLTQNAEMKNHLEEKEASKKRLIFHREIPKKNTSILCTSFDLQKVLNTPYGNSMLLFYSRKYTVYNLCFYESVTRNGYCYIWGESEGKRGGNEIATILQKYIKNCDERGTIKTLILYADSCPGQNKNKIVLAAIHNALLLAENLETIQVNYLLPGHTEMTVDSMHSTIENSVRNTIVWAPSQWLTVCQMSRKEPGPYNVEGLTHEDFKNYEEFSEKYFKGNLAGKISKIRVATFKKSTPNIMTVKYSMKDDAREESISIFAKPKQLNAKYTSSLPITKTKYNDLKKLCDTCVIPKVFHGEYLNFPNHNGKDVLIDTDVEDEVEVEERE